MSYFWFTSANSAVFCVDRTGRKHDHVRSFSVRGCWAAQSNELISLIRPAPYILRCSRLVLEPEMRSSPPRIPSSRQMRQSFIPAPLQFSSIHTQPPGHQGSSPFSHPLRICGLRRKQRSPASFHSATGFRPYRLFARDEARSARADLNWIHGVRSGKHGGTSGQIVR